MKSITVTILTAATAVLTHGCSAAHVAPYVPKHREYEMPAATQQQEQAVAPGSLWRTGKPGSMLFTDWRAVRENDLVVVKIEEIADARRTSDTELNRSAKTSASLSAFLQSAGVKTPDVAAEAAGASTQTFSGDGSTKRTERLIATVPALVRKVLPNGNLFVEGHRVVLVNAEEHHFYISGVVRPIDIDQQNSVKSSMIADAEVEFTGQGNLTDNQRQGWLSRFFSWIWPF